MTEALVGYMENKLLRDTWIETIGNWIAACQKYKKIISVLSLYLPTRHMKEISELQAFQRNEIEHLYKELGKTLPPNVGLLHAAPPSGRRRRASKHKLKAGKLLNPMVQQLRNNLNTSTERKGMWAGMVGWQVVCVLICVYERAFSVWSTQVENTGMASDSENRRSVWFTEWFTLTHTFFFSRWECCQFIQLPG